VYEAAVHWRNLGKRAVEQDTRVNYPRRAQEEKAILVRLLTEVNARTAEDVKEYSDVLSIAEKLLDEVATIPASPEGYLGFLDVVKTAFRFLEEEYRFQILREEPTCVRYSTGQVYVELQYSANPIFSCSFGPDDDREVSFWTDDLLYAYGDERYRIIRKQPPLRNRDEVSVWLSDLADIWRQHGHEVLVNSPGIFERLAIAQEKRDKEYTEGNE
jgi:hypothetical protein